MSKLTYAVYPAVAILALAAAFAAHAAPVLDANVDGYNAPVPMTSNVSRAQVKAEVARARANGQLNSWAEWVQPAVPAKSNRTRAEVRGEAIAARDAGYDAAYREGYDPQYAMVLRAKSADPAQVMASASAKAAQ